MNEQVMQEVNIRYSGLAQESCCLSCGGAVDHSGAAEGEICADLGSGRGNDVLRLADTVGQNGFVYGIDISEGMLSKARKQAERLGVRNVEFRRSDLEVLPIEDGHVDLIISNCTINHVQDKQKVWNEIHRILKPGGRFVISDIYALQPVPEEYRTDPKAIAECWAGSVTREEYEKQLLEAGFTEVEILEQSSPYEKGAIEVVSWTILGVRPGRSCSCGR